MTPNIRKAWIKDAGYSGAEIARFFGIKRSAVSLCLSGKQRSKRIEQKASEITGKPLWEIFPEWYSAPK